MLEIIRAQYNLGCRYQYGQGVTQDYKEAFKWYKMSADQNFNYGQRAVAEMYQEGIGSNKVIKLL